MSSRISISNSYMKNLLARFSPGLINGRYDPGGFHIRPKGVGEPKEWKDSIFNYLGIQLKTVPPICWGEGQTKGLPPTIFL